MSPKLAWATSDFVSNKRENTNKQKTMETLRFDPADKPGNFPDVASWPLSGQRTPGTEAKDFSTGVQQA